MEKTKETVETLRPEIALEAMELDKVDNTEFDGDYCLFASIPLKRTSSNAAMYDTAFECFLNQYINENDIEDVVVNQEPNLFLTIDGSDGEQISYLQSFIKIDYWGGKDEVCMTEEIQLSPMEQARVNLSLLKFSNPEEYLRQYTRQQVANLPQITKNKMGFVMDEIDENDLYKSVWLAQGQQMSMLACVEKVHDNSSKIQLLKIGQ